jgi:hypothetical protein
VYSLRVVAKLSSVMISLKCSGPSKKRRMEDRDATRTSRTSTLHPSRTCTLHPSRRSTLLGGDHPTGADDKAPDRRLLQPPDLGQDCATATRTSPASPSTMTPASRPSTMTPPATPTYRCLPSVGDDIATDYGLFAAKLPATNVDYGLFDAELPVTIAMSGLGGDITGNTEDDPACAHLPGRGQHFLSGPTPVRASCR